jgi:ferredoxin
VLSALDVLTADLGAHVFRGGCGVPVRGVLPLPGDAAQPRLLVDWTRCAGHGLCARLVPELIQLDRQGYPVFLDMPVPFWLEREARQAVAMCPALALRVEPGTPRAALGGAAVTADRTLVRGDRDLPRAEQRGCERQWAPGLNAVRREPAGHEGSPAARGR